MSSSQKPSFAVIARMLAERDELANLLPHLHQEAVDALSGCCSVLFQMNPRTGRLHPTSGSGVSQLPTEAWPLPSLEARVADEVLGAERPLVVPDLRARMPALAGHLGVPAAVLVPLMRQQQAVGLLVVGLREGASAKPFGEPAEWIGHAFVLALEYARLQREVDLQAELRTLLDAFSRVASSALHLGTGLEVFCRDANRLFRADRTSIWLHDRRARDLVLAASSDAAHLTRGTRVASDSPHSPAAVAMRRERAEMKEATPGQDATLPGFTVTVPLRGRRRALGTLVFDGVRVEPGGDLDLLDRADELGRQLSGAIENVQLLEDVLRTRRELEHTVNSIPDLVAVCDARLRLIHINQAFAERLGLERERAAGRPMSTCVGLDTIAWIGKLDLWSPGGTTQTFTRQVDDPVLNGTFALTVTALLGPEGDPLGAVIVARDVTRQASMEARHRALDGQAARLKRLAMLGQHVAQTAPELNAAITAVQGYVKLVQKNPGARGLRADLLPISREADRAAQIVRDQLVLAGQRKPVRRTIRLNALVSRAVALRSAARRAAHLDLTYHQDQAEPLVVGDASSLQRALLGLFANAEAATAAGAGGAIEVHVRSWPSRGLAVIEIRDGGPPIPAEALDRVFDPLADDAEDDGPRSALKLAVASGIVEDHGGKILAANHQQGGAVFTVELPIASAERS